MANQTYLISVTETDIQLGIARDPEHCPVSLAIWRAIGPALVSPEEVLMGRNGTGRKGDFPVGVRTRIRNYDTTGRMRPFSFKLTLDKRAKPQVVKASPRLMNGLFREAGMTVDFRRDERPAEPAEVIFNWSVQVPLDHQLTFGELSEALHEMRVAGVTNDSHVQVNGNLVMAWKRKQLG